MRWKVLVSAPYFQPVVERHEDWFREHDIEVLVPPVQERLGEEELLELIADIDGVICGDDRFTERVLRAAPRLKVISKWGTGIDSIDRDACARMGIAVRNTLDAFTAPVADTALGYILSFARNLEAMDREMKQGRWRKIPGRSLSECTLGVIGVGRIGQALIRRVRACGMRVLGTDPVSPPPSFLVENEVEMVTLDRLLEASDFVSVHCDLNPTSHHLLDDGAFSRMKPSAVVINTARGPVVDEAALIRALEDGRIAGAALDVFEQEPLPPDSPLRRMAQVLLAPHNSNSSPSAWERVHQSTLANLLAELEARAVTR